MQGLRRERHRPNVRHSAIATGRALTGILRLNASFQEPCSGSRATRKALPTQPLFECPPTCHPAVAFKACVNRTDQCMCPRGYTHPALGSLCRRVKRRRSTMAPREWTNWERKCRSSERAMSSMDSENKKTTFILECETCCTDKKSQGRLTGRTNLIGEIPKPQ